VRACEDLYIKSYVPSTGEQTTQLKRKAGVVPMAYESLELSVDPSWGQTKRLRNHIRSLFLEKFYL
jgi:hypothetical protein